MLRWIVRLVGAFGYWGIGLLMAIENVVLPLPSEIIMPLGGFQAARGRLTLVGAILVGTIGSVVGALPLYGAGRALGQERVSAWVDRHGRWILLRGGDLRRAGERFERHGWWAVFFSQLLPGIRGLISLPAGFARMNVALFAAANFAGTLIWCAVLTYLGFQLGMHYQAVHRFVGPAAWIVLGGVVISGIVWLLRRRRAAKRKG